MKVNGMERSSIMAYPAKVELKASLANSISKVSDRLTPLVFTIRIDTIRHVAL